jgi:hypothetical protein
MWNIETQYNSFPSKEPHMGMVYMVSWMDGKGRVNPNNYFVQSPLTAVKSNKRKEIGTGI